MVRYRLEHDLVEAIQCLLIHGLGGLQFQDEFAAFILGLPQVRDLGFLIGDGLLIFMLQVLRPHMIFRLLVWRTAPDSRSPASGGSGRSCVEFPNLRMLRSVTCCWNFCASCDSCACRAGSSVAPVPPVWNVTHRPQTVVRTSVRLQGAPQVLAREPLMQGVKSLHLGSGGFGVHVSDAVFLAKGRHLVLRDRGFLTQLCQFLGVALRALCPGSLSRRRSGPCTHLRLR